jgi:hypothetical protein
MDDQVAIIGQHPLGLVVAFHTDRQLTGLPLQLEPYVVADGLHLALIRACADHEKVGERSDRSEIENPDIGSFLGFGGSDSQEPGWG